MLSSAHKVTIIQTKKQLSKAKRGVAQKQRETQKNRKAKTKKAHTSTLREVKLKYTYIKNDDLHLEVNTAILEAF